MVEVGDVFEHKLGRLVCRYVSAPADPHESVFLDTLPGHRVPGGFGFHGQGAHHRCIREFGEPVARMRFNGAWKLYRRASVERDKAQYFLDTLTKATWPG